jgi:cytochrome c-type biogenesis protein CcmH/NrfF
MKRTLVAGFVGLVCLFGASPSFAHADPEGHAIEFSGQIMSPFCPGVTLHECPSAEAVELREQIAVWFASGWSDQAVMSELERQYGSSIRAAPATEGAGLGAWIVPILILLVFLALAGFLLRTWLNANQTFAEEPPLSREESVRLHAELDALRDRR